MGCRVRKYHIWDAEIFKHHIWDTEICDINEEVSHTVLYGTQKFHPGYGAEWMSVSECKCVLRESV